MTIHTAAQTLVKSLANEGVEFVIGLPGVQIMDIYDALLDELSIRTITVRHEQTASYMADGFARSTGKIAAALVVPGPGLQNASAGIGSAYASSSPVLLIVGQVDSADIGKNAGAVHEIVDQLDILNNVTKWKTTIQDPGEIPDAIHEAMRQLKTGRPRPVAIEIPSDLLPKKMALELPPLEDFKRQAASSDLIRKAASLLLKAKYPVIWAGGGVNLSDASHELTTLASVLNSAVIVTAEGKGAISEDDPHYTGPFYYSHGPAHEVIPKSDVILAVGSRLHFLAPVNWAFTKSQYIIHIDADPEELGRNWQEEVSIVGDAKLALQALLDEINNKNNSSHWTFQEIADHKTKSDETTRLLAPDQVEILQGIRKVLPDNALVVSGINSIGYWAHLAFTVRSPRSYFNASYFATLGYAFPFSLGVKLGNPDKPVIALCGDGGFMYGLSELATAVQENINVIVLVFNDQALGATLRDQQVRYRGRVIGTKIHNPDFAQVAKGFGALGIRLSHYKELPDALQSVLSENKPVVIDIPIDSWTPPFQIAPPGFQPPKPQS
jgi:acetolactate synthase-1/2/3 large subunit